MNKNKEVINLIEKQILILKNMTKALDVRLPKWKDQTIKILSEYVPSEDLQTFNSVNDSTYEADKIAYLELLNELKMMLTEFPQELIEEVLPKTPIKSNSELSKKVFIVHGHDALAKTEVARTLEKIGLEPIVLHEQPNEGKTVIEKFERDASQVSFAVIILSPDDSGHPINKPSEIRPRARQNVVLELGYFSGILGRNNIVVLHKGEVEIPSDYLGVLYISMDSSGAWQYSLAKELKRAGLTLDLNKLL